MRRAAFANRCNPEAPPAQASLTAVYQATALQRLRHSLTGGPIMASLQSSLGRGVLIALVIPVVMVVMFAPSGALAQTGGGGSIQGTITDSGGSVVAGATVVATNVARGVGDIDRSNEAGLGDRRPWPPRQAK